MAKLTATAVEEKLREYNGNMAAVGRALGVTRVSVFQFVQRHPTLQQVMLDCRETRVDTAESALDRAVLNGEGWSISLTLKTIGKNRGYVEQTETIHSGAIQAEVTQILVSNREEAKAVLAALSKTS